MKLWIFYSCIVLDLIQAGACSLQEFPTDMPISGRGLLRNKDGRLKAYMSKLNNIKILPAASAEDSTSYVDLLVEEERVPVPYVQKSQIEKIQLDKGKIERYLDVLSLEERPSTIKLDQSRILGYIMELASTRSPEQEVLYKPRIKLMKAAAQAPLGRGGETLRGKGALRLARDTREKSVEDGYYVLEEYDEPGPSRGNEGDMEGSDDETHIMYPDGLYRKGRDIRKNTDGDFKSQTESSHLMNNFVKPAFSESNDIPFKENPMNDMESLNHDLIEDTNRISLGDTKEMSNAGEDDKSESIASFNNDQISNMPSQNVSRISTSSNANSVNALPVISNNVNQKDSVQYNNQLNNVNLTKQNDLVQISINKNQENYKTASQKVLTSNEKNDQISIQNDLALRNLNRNGKNVSNIFVASTVTSDYQIETHTEIISKPSQNVQSSLFMQSNPSNAVKNVINMTADLNGNQGYSNATNGDEEKILVHEPVTTAANIESYSIPQQDTSGIQNNASKENLVSTLQNAQNIVMSKSNNNTQESPNVYNTVLDLMGLSPHKLFENPFPANMSSLSIHIFGPDVTKSLTNESWPNNLLSKLQEIILPNGIEAAAMPGVEHEQNHTKIMADTPNSEIASNVVKDTAEDKFSTALPQINSRAEEECKGSDQVGRNQDGSSAAPATVAASAEINTLLEIANSQSTQSQDSRHEAGIDFKTNENSYNEGDPSKRFNREHLSIKNGEAMTMKGLLRPTKPPEMFDSYYNFIRKELMKHKNKENPKFDATNEHELYKIVFQNLEGINADKGSLFKIIGRAVEGVENENSNNMPKWVKERKEEEQLASHMGQRYDDKSLEMKGEEVGVPVYPEGMARVLERDMKRSIKSGTPRAKPRKRTSSKQNPDILFPLKT